MKTKILSLPLLNGASNYQANVSVPSSEAEPTAVGIPTTVKTSVTAAAHRCKLLRLFGYNACAQDVFVQLWEGAKTVDGQITFDPIPIDGTADQTRTLLYTHKVIGEFQFDLDLKGLDVETVIAVISTEDRNAVVFGLTQAVSINAEIETL